MRSVARRQVTQRLAVFVGRARPRQRPLGFGGDRGERRPQLVRGVGGESLLAVERAMQPIECAVERLRHLLQLVLGALDGDPRVKVAARHLGGRAVDAADRRQRAADQEPAARERHQQRGEPAERRRRRRSVRTAVRVGEVATDQHERAAGAGDGQFAPAVARRGARSRRRRNVERHRRIDRSDRRARSRPRSRSPDRRCAPSAG